MSGYGRPEGVPSAPAFEAPLPYSPPAQQMPMYQPQPGGPLPNQLVYLTGYPQPQVYPAGPPAFYAPAQTAYLPPPYCYPPQAGVPTPQNHYLVTAEFDPGARFNQHRLPRVPPPPPGCPPNAAQLAMMSGQPTIVVSQQRRGDFLAGSGSGGFKFL